MQLHLAAHFREAKRVFNSEEFVRMRIVLFEVLR